MQRTILATLRVNGKDVANLLLSNGSDGDTDTRLYDDFDTLDQNTEIAHCIPSQRLGHYAKQGDLVEIIMLDQEGIITKPTATVLVEIEEEDKP